MNSGIYMIYSPYGEYIGSAVDIKRRWMKHKAQLRNNNHPNKHMQHAWNKYSESAFSFIVLEYCDKDVLLQREQIHLNTLFVFSDNPYNKATIAGNTLGVIPSLETRAKLSAIHKGKKRSAESVEKYIKARKGKSSNPTSVEKMRLSKSGTWYFINPEGEPITIVNLSKFCRDNKLDKAAMQLVHKGKNSHHKGWRKP